MLHKTDLDDEQCQRALGIVFGRVKAVDNTPLAWSAGWLWSGFHRRGHGDRLSGKRIVFCREKSGCNEKELQPVSFRSGLLVCRGVC